MELIESGAVTVKLSLEDARNLMQLITFVRSLDQYNLPDSDSENAYNRLDMNYLKELDVFLIKHFV